MSQLPGSPAYGLAAAPPPTAPSSSGPAARSSSGPWPVFWLAAAGTFLAYLDVTIVNIAFPSIASDFSGAGLGELSWVVNAYALAFAALLVIFGRVADRVGRRRIYLTGAALFALSSAACAVAPSVGVLVAARTVQGAAASAMIPAALGLLLVAFPPQRWAAAIAAWGAVGSVAAALGPPIGGLLADGGGWRWIFVINIPVGIATVLVGRRMLRESRVKETARPDVLGAVLLAGGVGALALALVQGEAWGWGSAATLGAFAAALVLGSLLAARTRRIAAPVFEPALLRTRWARAANAGTMAFGAALFASQLCAVLFATSVWGWSVLEAGLAAIPGPIASAVAAPIGGRWASRSGPRPVAIAGAALFALSLLWVVIAAGPEPDFVGVWLPYGIVGGAGIGLGLPALIGATATGLPPARFATGMALATTARQLGAVLGVALLVAVVGTPAPDDAVAAYHGGFALCAGALAVAAACAWLLTPAAAQLGARSSALVGEPLAG
jgi:EmrB/QacA subfamily drug resistance transporter